MKMDKYKHDVAIQIKKVLADKKISINQLCVYMECPYTTVYRILNEQVVPDLKTLCRICKVLQIGFAIHYSCFSDSLEVVF